MNLGGGVDVDVARRFKCVYDCADGFGVQYQQVQFQIGDGPRHDEPLRQRRRDVLDRAQRLARRALSLWVRQQKGAPMTGERSIILALRAIHPVSSAITRRSLRAYVRNGACSTN